MKFPKEFDTKLDLRPVNWEAMKGWIAKRVTELLGIEDEVLIAYIFEQLEGKQVSLVLSDFQPMKGSPTYDGRLPSLV